MVRAILEKMSPAELRKYISAHNKVVRKYIGVEIKQARAAYSQTLKVRRREMKAAQTIDAKGKKKEELIELIMQEPTLVKQIKADKEQPAAPAPVSADRRKQIEDRLARQKKKRDEERKKKKAESEAGPAPAPKRTKPKKTTVEPGFKSMDRQIGGALTDLVNQRQVAENLQFIKNEVKSRKRYLSESKGVLSPNYTVEKYGGGSFKIQQESNDIITDFLFDKKGELINKTEIYRKKPEAGPAPAPVKKVSVERLNRIRQKIRDLGRQEVAKKIKLADEIEKVARDLKLQKAREGKKPLVKPKPPASEVARIPKMRAIIAEGAKKGVRVKGLETQLRELENKFDLSDIPDTPPPPKPKAKPKAPTAEDIKKAALAAAEEETDDEDETPDPPIKAVPKRLHTVWKNYMEERVGEYYSSSDQQDEIDDFKSAEKDYLSNEKIRADTSVSASKQAKARNANARTRESMNDEFKTDIDIKKLYKEFAPRLLKKFEEFEKDLKKTKEAERKAQAAAAKEQIKFEEELAKKKQKEAEAEEKRIAKFEESERKRKEAAKKTASKEIKSGGGAAAGSPKTKKKPLPKSENLSKAELAKAVKRLLPQEKPKFKKIKNIIGSKIVKSKGSEFLELKYEVDFFGDKEILTQRLKLGLDQDDLKD